MVQSQLHSAVRVRRVIFLSIIFCLLFFTSQAESQPGNRDSADYYFNLGKQEQEARRYPDAWRHYEQSAKFDDRNAETQIAIADVCLKMNRMAPAVNALEVASKLKPEDFEIQARLVKMYFDFGQHEKVIAMMPNVLSHKKDFPNGNFMLGKSYYTLQNYGKADEYLRKSLTDSANAEAAYLLGRMNVHMENYKAAYPFYKQALSLDSSQPSRYYEYAMVLSAADQRDEAVRVFQSALERGYKPRDDFYMNMAYAMADVKRSDEALSILKEILARRPNDIGLLGGIADVCYHSGKYKEAIGYWDQIFSVDETNAQVLYRIGMAYIKMGKESEGKQLCDHAIQMDPALGVLRHEKQMTY
jgi:tetratricopeptide (TPR) repeat protein